MTLDKLILKGAAVRNFLAQLVVMLALIMCAASSKSRNVELVECWGNIAPQRYLPPKGTLMRTDLVQIYLDGQKFWQIRLS